MSISCFFVADLHGKASRYEKLFRAIAQLKPDAVFMGGDLLPSGLHQLTSSGSNSVDFFDDFLFPHFGELQNLPDMTYPQVFIIPGNDDGRGEEGKFLEGQQSGLWHYIPNRVVDWNGWKVVGYPYVPPTPFLLKDWEKYDVSAYVDPGCVSPEEGYRSVPLSIYELRYGTIQKDLELLLAGLDMTKTIGLFHSPPYKTLLDRAALDGKTVDHVPLDVHVGSIAIQRMIEEKQPLITLHGHVHESVRLTGDWMQQSGATTMIGAAHDGPELALVVFDPEEPKQAVRELI